MQLGVQLFRVAFAVACILTFNVFCPAIAGSPDGLKKPSAPFSSASLAHLSVPFVENRGETDARVALIARTATGAVYVSHDGELTYALMSAPGRAKSIRSPRRRWAIKEHLVDAQVMHVRGAQATGTRVRHFVADGIVDAQAPNAFAAADFGEAWPGVRMAVRATGEQAEKFFYIAPGADVNRVRVDVEGVSALTAGDRGQLVAKTGIGDVLLSAPVAWQQFNGARHAVAVRYALLGARRYGFALGPHDARHTVVIDPIVQSTYIGGNSNDEIFAMAVHPVTGDIYVTGQVESTSLFPVSPGAIDATRAGFTDAFIARLPADLKTFTAVTYFGGAATDAGSDIKIHPINGDVYVLGATHSSTLPGTAGAAQATGDGSGTPFVTRLSADLQTLVRTTFYGNGALADSEWLTPGLSLAISPVSGVLYIAGSGHSTTVPNVTGGAISIPSQEFGYIATIAADLSSFGQATYLCGSDRDSATFAQSMTMDAANGDLVVLGQTDSGALPTTPGAAQPTNPAANDQQQVMVIARIPQQLTSITALTYYIDAFGHMVPVNVMVVGGNTVIGGSANSSATPLAGMAGGAIATPFLGADGDISNGFVVKFTNDLTTIIQGTYVRGDGSSEVTQVVYDPASDSFFATGIGNGPSGLGGFPALDPGTNPVGANSFVTQIAHDFKSFIHSNLLPTSHGAVSIARHPINGDLYVAGFGTGAPNTAGGAQPTYQALGGLNSGVITRLTVSGGAPSAGELAFGSSTYQTTAGTPGVVVVTRTSGSAGAVSVTVTTGDGTASAPADYTAVSTLVSFADGDSASKAVSIPSTARSSAEGNKTVNVTLSAVAGGATLGGQSTTVLTIGDASAPPPPPPAIGSLQFSAASYTVADNAGAVSIGITRTGGTAGAVSVTFATGDGTGLAGTNYTATTQTLSFADGDAAAKTVTVPVQLHGNLGSSVTVNLKLTGPTGGASLGSPATAVLTINATTPLPPPVTTSVTVTGKGGGGAIGTLEILLLGALALLRLPRGRRMVLCAAPLLFALAWAAPASADAPGFYAGVGVGQARSNASQSDIAGKLDAAGFPDSSVSLDDHKLGGKIYAGVSFTRYFALEAAYVDLNRVVSRSTGATTNVSDFLAAVIASHPYSARGAEFSAMASLPLAGGLSVFARGGGFVWRGKIEADAAGMDFESRDKTGLSGVLGGGVQFSFSTRLALRAEWERYFITRDAMDLATVGVRFKF